MESISGGDVGVDAFELAESAPDAVDDEDAAAYPAKPFKAAAELREVATEHQYAHSEIYYNHNDAEYHTHGARHSALTLLGFHIEES